MRTAPAFVVLLLLGACGPADLPAPVEADHRIAVTTARFDHAVPAGVDEAALAGLDAFLARNGVGYGDRIRLDGGRAEDRAAVAMHLADRLLPAEFGAEPGPAAGPVRVAVLRPVAQPPRCGNWSGDPTGTTHNQGFPPLGCATQANLAAMLADPSDALGGDGLDPANGENPARWVRAYREDRIRIVTVETATPTTGD